MLRRLCGGRCAAVVGASNISVAKRYCQPAASPHEIYQQDQRDWSKPYKNSCTWQRDEDETNPFPIFAAFFIGIGLLVFLPTQRHHRNVLKTKEQYVNEQMARAEEYLEKMQESGSLPFTEFSSKKLASVPSSSSAPGSNSSV